MPLTKYICLFKKLIDYSGWFDFDDDDDDDDNGDDGCCIHNQVFNEEQNDYDVEDENEDHKADQQDFEENKCMFLN